MKKCTKCKQLSDNFYPNSNTKDGLASWCKLCNKEFAQSKESQEYRRRRNLKLHYNITTEEFETILKEQNYRCAICQTDKPRGKDNQFHVDHCHKSNKVRGLLCGSCNVALGLFKENEMILNLAIKYIQKSALVI